MKDRLPTYPGRVRLTPVTGQENVFDMTMEDQPTQAGDPPTKANLLKDATAALYGLSDSAVPDDIFAFIGKYKQHWWSKKSYTSYYESYIGNKYPYAADYSHYVVIVYNNVGVSTSNPITVSIADTVSVSDDGTVSLVNPTVLTDDGSDWLFDSNLPTQLLGKYCSVSKSTVSVTAGDIFFVPENSEYYGYFHEVGMVSVYHVGSRLIQPGETTYVHSSDRNAYPDSGTVDGLTYEYLGIPFDNAVTAPKIATGSYTGIGTYGSANPNSLTFDFAPKILSISSGLAFQGEEGLLNFPLKISKLTTSYARKNSITTGSNYNKFDLYMKKSSDSKTIYWYVVPLDSSPSNSINYQLNTSGIKYDYIAIG